MSSVLRSRIVVGLGFGDEGKGRVVDAFCETAPRPLVIRYNGGPQAGHQVVRGGKRHIFSSFGSGTLQGVPSFFGPKTLIYLPNLMREYHKLRVLNGLNTPVELYIDPRAQVILPVDIAFGRARETCNGHGSCGLGVGAAMGRIETSPYDMPAGAMIHQQLWREKFAGVSRGWGAMVTKNCGSDFRRTYQDEYELAQRDWNDHIESFCSSPDIKIMPLPMVISKTKAHMLIFEGAQGVMLDRSFGRFPNVTYADTTSKNAWEILRELGLTAPADVIYVHRSYTTRHGSGWMPSEWDANDIALNMEGLETEHNTLNKWQGSFRLGETDWELVKAAMQFDRGYHSAYARSHMVITCTDQRPTCDLPIQLIHDTWGLDWLKLSRAQEGPFIQA
jgi:adenylosuccinate synthase